VEEVKASRRRWSVYVTRVVEEDDRAGLDEV
jgi:hypothetical protein